MNDIEYNDIVTYSNFFSDVEIDLINKMASSIPSNEGLVGGDDHVSVKRKSVVKWIDSNEDTKWLFDKITKKVISANSKHFYLDLTGGESFQYTIYKSPGGTYGQHADVHNKMDFVRKISCTIQLSDENDYEGGDVLCYRESFDCPTKLQRDKGSISFFLSSIIHEVTPVTNGTRISLVCWFSGPPLR